MTGNLLFLLLSAVLILAILITAGFYLRRLRRSARTEWEDLLTRLTAVDRIAVDAVALDAIQPSGERRTDRQARELEPEEIWRLLGGLEGVERLEANSHVLVEMAAYLQRSYRDGAPVAEQLRLEAKELEWHVARLRMAAEQGSLEFHINTYAQNVAIAYYLMEHAIQAYCERTNLPNFRPLQGTR